ncbi:MFS general substrate transporter [Punctularia strigosozonata HHB-11173 SS5]|uniref:MFS general substrate transporter n=1 Tax=Punctularia strigosozonata (strain HHB-11173) TaxID=741275 RepID=UPI0004417E9F|nr:MFS general substrate transporter [Punctularia strigosozonata HHB-11173 SS5]EIN05355.1 MFS general substrate transporter [Punctularia strigosozonata HHB-11173 SS5]
MASKQHSVSQAQEKDVAPIPVRSTVLSGSKLAIALVSLYGCLFLVMLDQLILTTSSPHIVSQFNALGDIAWITTAYFVGQASTTLMFGKLTALFPTKLVLLSSIFVFEAGSAISGAAPSMNVLLFSRTLQGIGGGGLSVSTFATIANITTLKQRGWATGLVAMVFALSSVVGPLVGGAFADSSATWRWCFYINLPIGGLASLVLLLVIPYAPATHSPPGGLRWYQVLSKIDLFGCILAMGATVCFLVPLTTGGNVFAWKSAVVCTLFPVSVVFFVALMAWCRYRGPDAILPLFLLRNKSMNGACGHGFFIWGAMMITSVYLPYYLQAIKGVSAIRSAVELLPFMICGTVAAAIGGAFISRTGHVTSWLVFPPVLCAIGYGLMFTLDEKSSMARVYGLQVLVALGVGAGLQQNLLVPQIIYQDNPIHSRMGMSLILFLGFIGRSLAIAIAGAVLLNRLGAEIPKTLPGAPASIVHAVKSNVDSVRSLSDEFKPGAVLAYARALQPTLIIGLPFSIAALLSALFISRSIAKKAATETRVPPQPQDAEAGAATPVGEAEIEKVQEEA